MLNRIAIFSILVSTMILPGTVRAEDETHQGKVISVGAGEIVVLDDKDGDNDRFAVSAETKITRNGKPAKLSEVFVGDRAKVIAAQVNGKLVAKSIEARAPE
jgi:hypothetical protein